MKNIGWIAVAVLAAWAGGVQAASETNELIQQAIRGANTNVERAQKLLDAAALANDDAKLAAALLEKAVEFAVKEADKPAARELAEKALDLLASKTELTAEMASQRAELHRQVFNNERSYEGKERAARKLVPALMETGRLAEAARKYQLACDAYSEVETVAGKYKMPEKSAAAYRAQRAKALVGMASKEKQLQAALKTNAADTKSRMALLKLLVFEKDAPDEAARWLADDVDQAWQANIKLAAGDSSALAEAGARELGDWYYARLQASESPMHVKGAAAGRAQTYYTQFLAQHKGQDQPALKAKLALKQIEAFMASTDGGLAGDNGTIDLLALVDTAKGATSGQWVKNETGLACASKDRDSALLEISPPAKMPKKYELSVTFARLVGNSTIAIVFPFGSRQAVLVLDNFGRFSGLEHLDPTSYYYYYYSPPGRAYKRLDNKKAYTATVTVTPQADGKTRIVASLNEQELSNWTEKESELMRGGSDWVLRNSSAFGLGVHRGQAIFNKMRLKPLK